MEHGAREDPLHFDTDADKGADPGLFISLSLTLRD